MEKLFKKIIYEHKKNLLLRFIFYILLIFSYIYRWIIVAKRRKGYKKRAGKSFIISIGNITTGGTGKTPFTIFLAKLLAKRYKLCIILRGYKGKYNKKPVLIKPTNSPSDVGDEPLLIHRETGLPVIICKNRINAVEFAEKKFKPDIIILDDAFQHFQLKRDVNIVLIDYFNPFGNRYLIPAGILREPLTSLKDADYVVITKYEKSIKKEYSLKNLKTIINSFNPNAKIFCSNFILHSLNLKEKKVSLRKYKNKKLLAICGIANPDYFEYLVKKYLTPEKITILKYPDHYFYSDKDIEYILNKSKDYDFLITTEKDYIKIKKYNLLILVFKIKFNITDRKFLRTPVNEIKKV